MTNSSKLLTILFADIGSSAALYGRVGDNEAHRLVTNSLASMKQCIEHSSGTVLRTVGDAVLASFECCDQAFEAACDIQQVHLHMPLSVRVGFHTGSVIPDGGDVYGHAVNIAARVAAFARVDEIMATSAAVEQLSTEHQACTSGEDSIDVRGVPDAVRIHRVMWQESSGAVTQLAARSTLAPEHSFNLRLKICHGSTLLHVGPDCCDINLGRAEDNHVSVVNSEASRHHAQIQYRHGQFVLHDESTNGTYVQKDSLLPFLVRRDSIVLDGRGVICLGATPDEAGSELIEFELLQG